MDEEGISVRFVGGRKTAPLLMVVVVLLGCTGLKPRIFGVDAGEDAGADAGAAADAGADSGADAGVDAGVDADAGAAADAGAGADAGADASADAGADADAAADSGVDAGLDGGAAKALGLPCDAGGECASTYCVDGVCCGMSTCAGCSACNVDGGFGTCNPVPFGQDPHDACQRNSVDCKDDYCNGSGGCAVYSEGTICGTSTCSNHDVDAGQYDLATLTAGTCNGTSETCGTPAFQSCPDASICQDLSTCIASCVVDAHCTSGHYCADTGTCKPKGIDGADCVAGSQCLSGVCTSITGLCAPCLTNLDCSPQQAKCSASASCSSCNDLSDCSNFGFGNACQSVSGNSKVCLCLTSTSCRHPRSPYCGLSSICGCGAAGAACLRASGQICTTSTDVGVCKVAPGGPCQTGSDCAGGDCDGGACWKLGTGQPCRTDTDCKSNACQVSLCLP